MVITAQSLHGFEEGPVLHTGGEAMLSVLSAGSGRSARGHRGRQRGYSKTSKQRGFEGVAVQLPGITAEGLWV